MARPNFEKFRRYKVTEGDEPFVSLHKRGIFAFNRNAYEKLGEPEAVEILYAPNENIIGFQAAKKSSPDAYVVRHSTKSAFQVEGRAVLKYYEIPKEAAGRRYHAEMVDDILTINLEEGLEN